MLFECGHAEKCELVIGCELVGGAGHNHRAQLFVLLVEIFHDCVGNGDEVCVEVFRVADEGSGIYDVDEGFGGEIACALALCGRECTLGLIVLAKLGLDVVVDALYFLDEG